jgi:hypothetical protein
MIVFVESLINFFNSRNGWAFAVAAAVEAVWINGIQQSPQELIDCTINIDIETGINCF